FVEYARLGKDLMVYLRLVDTETTGIRFQASNVVDESKPLATVEALLSDVVEELTRDQELKGLIADAALDDAVIINIGSKHGVSAGQEFVVIDDGEPIEAGGRVIGHRQRPVARLT